MADLYSIDRVEFECNCGELLPSLNMYFCRHCMSLRCFNCSWQEIDSTFCPNCLENPAAGEARLKKNRCSNCNQCPICGTVLMTRAVGDMCHLICSTCRWSTRDSDIQEQPGANNWPMHESPYAGELNQVLEKLSSIALAEKQQRDQIKISKRRSNTAISGSTLGDRCGLLTMYKNRKKAFERPTMVVPVREATEDVPVLDFSLITDGARAEEKHSLDVILKQPLCGDRPLKPLHMTFVPKMSLRCKDCTYQLMKLEVGPCPIKSKVQCSTLFMVPVIRLSREPELVDNETCAVLITVTNCSTEKVDVLLMPDNQEGLIECLTPLIELTLARPDEGADVVDASNVQAGNTSGDNVVFRGRHRAGIRLEVKGQDGLKTMGLLLKFRNPICSANPELAQAPQWNLARVRIHLTK